MHRHHGYDHLHPDKCPYCQLSDKEFRLLTHENLFREVARITEIRDKNLSVEELRFKLNVINRLVKMPLGGHS